MKFVDLNFGGLKLIELNAYKDDRGFFLERYNRSQFSLNSLNHEFVQDNYSLSAPGVLRGMHYQIEPSQGKLVQVLSGGILDVVVDLRKDSPSFKQAFSIELHSDAFQAFWIPAGFAHGFVVTSSEPVLLTYKVDQFYNAKTDSGFSWRDPLIRNLWKTENPMLSDKDRQLGSLDQLIQKIDSTG